MILKGIKLITFDATNTLLRFRVPPWQHYAVIAEDHGFKCDEVKIKNRFKDSYKVMWNNYPNFGKGKITWENWWIQIVKSTFEGLLPKHADLNSIANILINEFKTSKCWCLANGSERLLSLINERGISIGVISNFDPRLHEILKNVSIIKHFDFIITSYEVGIVKPDTKIFKYAMEKSGLSLKSSEVLHIGDNVKKDYKGARDAGWHAALITNNQLKETPPALKNVFTDLVDLSIAIEQNNPHL